VGQVAGRTLTDRIDGEGGTAGIRLLFPELVQRSSTAPHPPDQGAPAAGVIAMSVAAGLSDRRGRRRTVLATAAGRRS